jgi:hypothetical protein
VQVTVLEPGGMRTDWAGSSMTIPVPSAPYQPTIGAFAELVRAASGHEATNTRRVAQVVRDLAGRDMHPREFCSAPMQCRWRSGRHRNLPPATRPGEKSA